jgi:hypothetical protein
MSKQILIVGHCNFDGPRLVQELSEALPEAAVERVNSMASLRTACAGGAALLLLNREPVGFDEDSLDLVKMVCSEYPESAVMLVSDLPDAQTQAVEAGAVPGFGKSEMGSQGYINRIAGLLKD